MDINRNTPVKLAYKFFEPFKGADKTLSPAIFLHGVTSTKESWNSIPQEVADSTKRMAYALDARNHGESEYSDVMNLDSCIEDISHFMETISAPKAIIIGHSMGGIIASRMALTKPERVEKLIVEECSIRRYTPDFYASVIQYSCLWREALLNVPSGMKEDEVIRFAVDYVYSKLPHDAACTTDKEKLYNYRIPLKQTLDGKYDVSYNFDVIIKSMKNPDAIMTNPQGIYNGPSYFLYGTMSSMKINEDENLIFRHFPRAKMIKFDKAKHNLHLEYPEKFTKTLIHCMQEKTDTGKDDSVIVSNL